MKSFAVTSYLQYFLSGLVITTVGSVMPQLLDYYGLSYTRGGQLVFLAALGFLLGVPFSYYLLNRFSEKGVMAFAAALIGIGQLGIYLLPPFGWVMGLNFVNSLGVGILETVVATLMMELFVGRRAVVMSYLEVSFGLGAFAMPMIASFLIAHDVWKYAFLVAGCMGIFMAGAWAVISFRRGEADNAATLDAAEAPPLSMSKRGKGLVLFLFILMIFVYAGIEGSINNFLSSIFITHLGEVSYYASISIGVYWAAMIGGRAATSWIIRKVSYSRFLFWSMSATFAGLVCFVLWRNAAAGYALTALLGFTMSGVYSITMVYANHTFPGMARLVTSLITGFAGLGMAVLPALIGYTMDHAGTAAALWLNAGFAAVYLVSLLTLFTLYKKFAFFITERAGTKPDQVN